jgi:hypothetical protein
MRKSISTVLIAASLGAASAAFAQTPAFDPREWKGVEAGPPTQVLTLGSAHLSQMATPMGGASMAVLIDKLAAFRPDIVTVENVSGEQCEHLKRYPAIYPDSFDAWCRAPDAAQKAIGMDTPSAVADVQKTLAAWPAQPTPAARRRLAALFLAAGETPSAVVQWLRLPPGERRVGDGVTAETITLLDRAGAKPNETYDIGVALAVRLGLERIYLVDDHTSDSALTDTGQAYGDTVQAAWKIAPSKAVAEQEAMEKGLTTPEDILALYRFLNRPDTLRQNIAADFRANLHQPSPQLYGRRYVAAWEVRNLRMVANIRAAVAERPGARVLNIVGSSHKPYYDAYLDLMPDVALVDAEAVLK